MTRGTGGVVRRVAAAAVCALGLGGCSGGGWGSWEAAPNAIEGTLAAVGRIFVVGMVDNGADVYGPVWGFWSPEISVLDEQERFWSGGASRGAWAYGW